MPNKHDGKSYRRIAAHRDGVPVFAAWTLLLEVASKMPTRGLLSDEDGPLDADDLAAMTGFPTQIFELAFSLLTQPKIAWLEVDEQESRSIPESPGVSRDFALEQNRIEEQGTTGNYKDVGSREKSRSPGSIAQRSAKSCDEEFLEELQRSEAYRMLNVRMLFARMVHWCSEHSKQPTRRRFIAWLNREDIPIESGNGTSKPTGYQTSAERRESAFGRQLALVTELRSRSGGAVN